MSSSIPSTLQIGAVEISPATLLAPMESLTDRLFRRILRVPGGCGLLSTEFVSASQLLSGHKKAHLAAALDPLEHPISVQIYGPAPEPLVEAAQRVEALGADLIDINMGCPSKRVTGSNAGAALMRDPLRAATLVRRVDRATKIPTTVKMRLGWSPSERNATEVARAVEEAGAALISVHARTKEQLYGGPVDWEAVREVVNAVSVPVVVNGDILTVEDALEALEISGSAGVMIGRGALRNPWLFAELEAHAKGIPFCSPSPAARASLLNTYIDEIVASLPEIAWLGRIKQTIGFMSRGIRGGETLREPVYHSKSVEEARAAISRFFAAAQAEDPSGRSFYEIEYESSDPRLKVDEARTVQQRKRPSSKKARATS